MSNIIIIKDEYFDDHITRIAGEKLRNRIIEILQQYHSVIIDFADVVIASTSFFDEGIAKLPEYGIKKSKILSQINLKNIDKRDFNLLKIVCQNRGVEIAPLICPSE